MPARIIASQRGIATPRAIASPRGWASPRGFTGVQGGAWLPSDLPDLWAWFRADTITGLSDGEAVAAWNDESVNGRNATQVVGDNQPLYKTNIQGGKPIVRFDGTNDVLTLGSQSLAQPFTIAWVSKRTGRLSLHNRIFFSVDLNVGYQNAVDKVFMFAGTCCPDAACTSAAFHYVVMKLDGASSIIRVDGADSGPLNPNTNDITAATCSISHASVSPFFGDLGELIIMSSIITASDVALLDTYLADGWDL